MKKTMVFAILGGALCALMLSCGTTGGGASGATWDWKVNGDEDNGGSSTIEMAEYKEGSHAAYKFTGNITNKYEYGFVNVKCMPDEATLENLKNATAISFRIKGDGDKYAVKIVTSDVKDYAYFEYAFDTVKGVAQTVVVPVEFLFQPPWGKAVGSMVNTANATNIEYQTTRNGSPGPYEFALWDLRVWTDGTPADKIEKKVGVNKPIKAVAESVPVGGDLGALELTLADNFQYGDGYQGVFSDKRLMNGHKIVAGETYTLKATFSPSRDLEDGIDCGLVDTTAAANYWRWLAGGGEEQGVDPIVAKKLKAGESVSVTVKLTTTAGATGASAPANTLVFVTKGEGKKGSANSGKMKAVTLKFTEFVFTQD